MHSLQPPAAAPGRSAPRSASRPLAPPASRPTLLFHCQHSVGIGHLTRSFALAQAMSESFRVVFLNGGRLPRGVPVPAGVERIDLPPLGMDDGHRIVSRDAGREVAAAQAARRRLVEDAVSACAPAVVVVELFPFGRKKFAGEILALIRAARRQAAGPARIVCSLRDILVDARPDQRHHDDRARWLANRYFDAILVHADPGFVRLEQSFRPTKPLTVPVHYTGFVVPPRETPRPQAAPRAHILVSAGGGLVGGPLFAAALDAHARLWPTLALPMRIVAGPFLPDAEWTALQRAAAARPGVELVRHVPDMAGEMRRARLSVSQCGYNTALDVVVAGVPALVVPYAAAGENEQDRRAAMLAARGALCRLAPTSLDGPRLAAAIADALRFTPAEAALDLGGAAASAALVAAMLPVRSRTAPTEVAHA